MTVSTANPAVATVLAGSWNAFSGSTALGIGSAVAVLTDSSNTTFVRTSTPATFSPSQIYYTLTDPTVGSGTAIQRIRVGGIVKNGDGSSAAIYLNVNGVNQLWSGYPNTSTAQTVYTGWYSTGTAISTTTANAAYTVLESYGSALRFTKLWVEYDLVTIPAGTPSVTAVNTDRPTITWNFTDGDGGVQAAAIVKVFSSAQYSAGGFNASTSTPLWSGTVTGTAQTITPATAIVTNGLYYKPFVQVYKNVNNTLIYPSTFASATSVSQASWTAPAAPTITTSWSSALARVTITTNGLAAPYQTTIFRGNGTTDPAYQVIKTTTDADGVVIAYDHFVPRSTAVVYGVFVTTGTVTPYLTSSASLSTVTTGTAVSWELRSVDQPATYINIAVPVTSIAFEQYEGQTVYRPIGSNYPVVVAGSMGGDDGTMTITTTDQTTWDDIKEILDLQSDLYLVSPFVDSTGLARRWFIRVTGRSWTESGIPAAQVRTATVSFVEVEAPEVAAD